VIGVHPAEDSCCKSLLQHAFGYGAGERSPAPLSRARPRARAPGPARAQPLEALTPQVLTLLEDVGHHLIS
jgi:hypothetical protein